MNWLTLDHGREETIPSGGELPNEQRIKPPRETAGLTDRFSILPEPISVAPNIVLPAMLFCGNLVTVVGNLSLLFLTVLCVTTSSQGSERMTEKPQGMSKRFCGGGQLIYLDR